MNNCSKCKGLGYIAKYNLFNNGICYNCNGTGKELTNQQKAQLKQQAINNKHIKSELHKQKQLQTALEMLETAKQQYNTKVNELEQLRTIEDFTQDDEEREDNIINDLATYSAMVEQWENEIKELSPAN